MIDRFSSVDHDLELAKAGLAAFFLGCSSPGEGQMRALVGFFTSAADASFAKLSSWRAVQFISTRGNATSGETRSNRGRTSTLRSPPALSLTMRWPSFRSETAHRNRATASDRKSALLVSCNSCLSKRTVRSSAGAKSAWNLALRSRLLGGESSIFFLVL